MLLNSIKTQLHHYLRALAIYHTWRSLGITFFFKVMGFFFPSLALSGWLSWSKGQSFLPHKIYSHVFYLCTFYSTREGNWGWFIFLVQSWEFFFFSFWLMMLLCDTTLSFPLEKCSFWSHCQLFTLRKVGSQMWNYRD